MKKLLKLGSVLFLSSTFAFATIQETNAPKNENSQEKKVINRTWIGQKSLSPLAKELINQLKSDKTISYDLPFFKLYKKVLKEINAKKFDAKLNSDINKLYFAYMNYLIKGGIDWKAFQKDLQKLIKKYDYKTGWETFPPPYSAKAILKNAKLSGTFGNIFEKVEPTRFKYQQLKKYLIKYIQIRNNGGWKTPGKIPTLRVGNINPKIPIIRKRLKIVGDLGNCVDNMDSTLYDSCTAKAIKRFRIRHGLKPSTIIDRATRIELNRPVSYYIRKMRLNLDRIKWSNRKEAKVRIELNIPAFRLYLYDGKDLVTTMRVVTGKPNHPTPVFSDVMTTIVINPYWRIPESIVKKEMIKHLIKDPHYYERQGKFLYKGWGPNSQRIDPATVDWAQYKDNKKHIPYHFLQNPGFKNALGKIKFLFPNKYSVYIHDTPSKRLFFRSVRAFSHGCMRIQKPRELLEALAIYNKNLNVPKIIKQLGTSENKQIPLQKRIPIDITYFTAFVDDYGNLHFRKDIYGYDRLQLKHYYKNYKATTKTQKTKKKKSLKKHTKPDKKAEVKKRAPKKATPKKDEYEVIEIGY